MFKSDSEYQQGGEESGYGGMGSSFSDKAIRLNFIRKVCIILHLKCHSLSDADVDDAVDDDDDDDHNGH